MAGCSAAALTAQGTHGSELEPRIQYRVPRRLQYLARGRCGSKWRPAAALVKIPDLVLCVPHMCSSFCLGVLQSPRRVQAICTRADHEQVHCCIYHVSLYCAVSRQRASIARSTQASACSIQLHPERGHSQLTVAAASKVCLSDSSLAVAMSVSAPSRLRFLQLRMMFGACTKTPAIAGSISLATLVFCLVYGSIFSSSICSRSAFELRKAYVSQGAVRPAALQSLATHEPYSTEPPSFLANHRYQGICNASRPQHREACTIGPYNPSSPGQAQPCTPAALRHWAGAGSWHKDEEGHYRWAWP